MYEWIDIDSEVPKLNQRFHAYHYSGPHWNHGAFIGAWTDSEIRESLRIKGYSHWMPLPEPPCKN